MKSWGKFVLRAFMAGLFCAGALMQTPASAASSEDLQFVKNAYDVNVKMTNGSVEGKLTVLSPYAKAIGSIQCHGDWTPTMLLQGELSGSYMTFAGMEKSGKLPLYIEQSGDQMTIFFNRGTKWEKINCPIKAADLSKAMTQQSAQDMLAMIKDVKVQSDTDKERTMLITLDGKKLSAVLKKYASTEAALPANATEKQKQAAKLQQAAQKQFGDAIYDSLGDMEYTWTVDKATMQTKAFSIDMTKPLRNVANNFLEGRKAAMKPAQLEVLQTLINSCQVQMDLTYGDPSKDTAVSIPKEVQQAKEYNPMADQKDKKTKK